MSMEYIRRTYGVLARRGGRMEYIRRTYGVPARRGGRVEYSGNSANGRLLGTITGARGCYLRVRMDGCRRGEILHPTWRLKYLDLGGGV